MACYACYRDVSMDDYWILVLTLVASFWSTGAIFMRVVRSIQAGEFKRNGWIGIRTPTLMASDKAWEKGHRQAAPGLKRLAYTCYAFAASHVVAFVLPQSSAETLVVILGLTQSAVMVGAMIWISIKASRAARE